MIYQKLKSNQYLIRLFKGEKILTTLKKFFIDKKIKGGFFLGIGAVSETELAHYDVVAKKYTSKKIQKPLEMTNLTGNIALFDKELIIHTHATFSDKKMVAFAGHLVEGIISGTAEIFLFQTTTLKKVLDKETGLKVFSL